MKTMTVGDLQKPDHRKVAALVPYSELKVAKQRPLGLLKAKVRVKFAADFAIDDDQFLKT